MGQEEVQYSFQENNYLDKITRNYFDFQYVIGKGGFGKVNPKYSLYNIMFI